MKYHLVTYSPTVSGIAYYDGSGFSRLKENGAKYRDVIAVNMANHVSETHSGFEIMPLPISWPRGKAERFMRADYVGRTALLKQWEKAPTAADLRRQANPPKKPRGNAKKKTPGGPLQHKYVAKLKQPGKRAVTTEFWSASNARAKNYATGLLLQKNPGAKCVSLMQTAQTRRVKKKVKK